VFPPVFKRKRSEDEADLLTGREIRAVQPLTADNGLDVPPFRQAVQPAEDTQMTTRQAPLNVSVNPPMPVSGGARPAALRPGGIARDMPAERRTLVVGRGISLQGTVQDAERLVVEGMVEASMIHATELSVAVGGVFKGEVEVEDCEVSGTVDGTLTARGNLVVRASGVILGVARCRRLQVEDGGQITGRIEMITAPARNAGE
jgi:cytoskeletal protein CcmA (bactofilin family)